MSKLIKVDAGFGKALIDAAHDKIQKVAAEQLTDEMRHMMTLADEQEAMSEVLATSAAALRRRLKAVEKGNFRIEGKTIKYLDDEHKNIIYREAFEFITRNIPNWTPRKK